MSLALDLQFAHVLFMDIVGFSRFDQEHAPEKQLALLQELQELVRSQPEFRRSNETNELLCLPTGDGMALVFFREPTAPLQCAVQIGRALKNRPHLKLRMGVHSGPVYRVDDINANANVSGGGINTAQRVMDCGDAGHILISRAVQEYVTQLGAWPLEDLGEVEVKHGVRLHLYSVHCSEFGNPARPEKLRRPATSRKVVLLYRRDTEPDEEVLQFLTSHLAERGHDVFWDRRITVGMKWAEEIERQIRCADAVVPLVSAASMHSEMLGYELQIAREAAETQEGRPRILPVRIRYTGALPEGLAVSLDGIEYALWTDERDSIGLAVRLEEALASPPPDPRPVTRRSGGPAVIAEAAPASPTIQIPETVAQLEPVGGAVPLDSKMYVARAADAEFLTAVGRRDSIVLVNGARQMGKTSLLARGLQHAREAGARVAFTDLQWLSSEQLQSADTLYRAFGESLADQLDLDLLPEEVWSARSGPSVNFQRYMRRGPLAGGRAVVWGLDEVDRLFSCPFGSEVFGLFRSWHNARALDPAGPWSQLTLVIAYATEAHLFITDVNQSPFNVGTRLTLADFTEEQVLDLNRRHGSPLQSQAEVTRFYRLLAGHPYLTRRGLHELVRHHPGITQFEELAVSNEGPFGDHLRRILVLLARDPALCNIVRGVLRGEPCPTPESFYRLRSAGLISGDSARDARPRCRLYALYLERHLL